MLHKDLENLRLNLFDWTFLKITSHGQNAYTGQDWAGHISNLETLEWSQENGILQQAQE